MMRGLLIAISALALSACAMSEGQQTLTQAEPPGDAEVLAAQETAEALALAVRARDAQDSDTLRSALLDLRRLRARPQEQPLQARMDEWARYAGLDETPMRGRTLGPAVRSGFIAPGQSKSLDQTFLSGRKATIAARSSDGRTVRLGVRDRSGRETCEKASVRPLCAWIPIYTSRYTISVSNPGDQRIEYFLVIE